jgi:eukaryotic-like serine/threonine-protein kinase
VQSPHSLAPVSVAARTPGAARPGAADADATIRVARRPRRAAGPPTEHVVLGRYRLIERLGSGGFGVVWRARDELLRREVAVKRIPLARGPDDARAGREALAGARLSHPAIVSLFEACTDADAFYLISELVRGQTLARLIAADELSTLEVLQIGAALGDALAHAHARGVVHRDVKPQNVLVPARAADERVTPATPIAKLTDFGGAHLRGEDGLTGTGDVLGTLAYMAPEQSDGREVAEPADVYALALVLYEALCGHNPVRGSTPAETARRIGRPIARLERARRDLPRSLTRTLDRALRVEPAQRAPLAELRGAIEHGVAALAAAGARPARPASGRLARAVAGLPAPLRAPTTTPRARARTIGRASEATSDAASDATAEEGPRERSAPRLPRRLWLGCGLAIAAWQLWIGRPGVALVVAAATVPLLALSRRAGAGWMTAALAPALGLAGLAGAFPAIAGQARRWTERAGLAALGYWWLCLAEPLLARRLWLGAPAGTPARAIWEGSLTGAGAHVLAPLVSPGLLLGALGWAAAAVVLPWLVRGRHAAADVVAVAMWAAALASAAQLSEAGAAVSATPRGLAVGVVLGAALAVAARALRGPV